MKKFLIVDLGSSLNVVGNIKGDVCISKLYENARFSQTSQVMLPKS
jgi:hypothetical protein